MNQQKTIVINQLIYYRLIALWVLSEAMLGGIIHGFKIPVSGLVVGSCAVLCICFIAYYIPSKGAIIKATVIVAVFKMMLSPQAPPPAYIAVFFQGLLGELLFWRKKFFRLACILLCVLALLESGLQRIFVLTIIYGNDLWKVINGFINGLIKQKEIANYSLIIGGTYVFLHLIVGLFVGIWAPVLPHRIEKWGKEKENKIVLNADNITAGPVKSNRKKKFRISLFIIWIVFIILYIQSYFKIGIPILPSHISLKILLRSFIIVLSWYFIVGSLVKRLLDQWLQKKKSQAQRDIQQVLALLPSTQQLILQCWKYTGGKKGLKRIIACSKMILVNATSTGMDKQIFILTGLVQTGKTTSLMNWAENRSDIYGILTPLVKGERVFMNVHTRKQFAMEAREVENEKEILVIGRFRFSKEAFDKGSQVIRDAMDKKGWLVIDEIGPLELKGEGFYEVLSEIGENKNTEQKILLVVREGLQEQVKTFFQLTEALLIYNVDELE